MDRMRRWVSTSLFVDENTKQTSKLSHLALLHVVQVKSREEAVEEGDDMVPMRAHEGKNHSRCGIHGLDETMGLHQGLG